MNFLLSCMCSLILFSHHMSAQSYFPQGASWIYHAPSFSSAAFSYTTIESKGDSIFNGDTLMYLEGYVLCGVGINELLKRVGDRIYKLNKCDSTFSLLYDFGANVGDTLEIHADVCGFNDTIHLVIDSIVPFNLNGHVLDYFHTTQLNFAGSLFFGGSMIEGIGNTYSFYPQIGFCDPIGGPLRCYNDSVFGEYNAGFFGGVCDTVYNDVDEHYLPDLSYFPNPTTGRITVELGEPQTGLMVTLTNALGQVIRAMELGSTYRFNMVIDAPRGIYFLRLEDLDGVYRILKVFKE